MTAKAAVVGWPIEHSLSPVLHGYWLKQYGIDGSYEKIAIEPGAFAQRIAELRDAGYRGVNVTVPFKEEAFAVATAPLLAAINAGAANVLIFAKDGRIGANNTDGTGLVDSLQQALGPVFLGGKNILVIGAGGAARGAILALYQHHVGQITVLNRNPERAHNLVQHVGKHIPVDIIRTGSLKDWQTAALQADLVINTTSAGMKGNPPLDIDLSVLPKAAAVCDIVYNPLETPLLKGARARGHQTIDGLGMLMHQAVPAFQAFFGEGAMPKMPEVTQGLRDALVKALQSRG